MRRYESAQHRSRILFASRASPGSRRAGTCERRERETRERDTTTTTTTNDTSGLSQAPKDAGAGGTTWTWNDQARTFKPPGARYCPIADAVFEDFDHTCPWTGTAIAKGNIGSFRFFIVALQFLFYSTIAVLVLAFTGVASAQGSNRSSRLLDR